MPKVRVRVFVFVVSYVKLPMEGMRGSFRRTSACFAGQYCLRQHVFDITSKPRDTVNMWTGGETLPRENSEVTFSQGHEMQRKAG